MAATVVVAADGELGMAPARDEPAYGRGSHARLVTQEQHERVGALVDDANRRRDRGRAAVAEVLVHHDFGSREIDRRAHVVRRAPQRHDQLVETALSRGRNGVVEQRGVPEGQQLLGPAKPA